MFRRKGESLTREDVINAALYCLETEGEKSLGINRVARELNIKPPSIYNHIKSNDDLRTAVAVEGWKKLYGSLAVTGITSKNPVEGITLLLNTYREFAHNNKSLYMVISTTSIEQDHPEFLDVSQKLFQLFNHILAGLKLSKDNEIHIIRWLRSMAHGFIILELQGQFEIPVTINDSYDFIIKTAIKVLNSKV
jgi:AcrR family transcriptional regulator